jgi:cell division septal protein FtsQ
MDPRASQLGVRTDRTIRQGLVKRRRRRMWRRLKGYARFLLACVLAYGLYRFWTSPIWQWNGQMAISGNRLVTRQALLDRINVPPHTPLYALNPQHIAMQLEGIPAIGRVAVRRWLLPARLEVNVLERQALVEVVDEHAPQPTPTPSTSPAPSPSPKPSGSPSPMATPKPDTGTARWIDQEGVVFVAPRRLMNARFPIMVHTTLEPGSHLPPKVQAHLFELLNAWPREQGGRLDLRNTDDVYASIGGWPVRLGEVDEVQLKFTMLAQLQPLAAKYKDRLKYINLRFPNSPTLVLKTGAEVKPGNEAAATPSPGPSPKASPP